MYDACDLYLHPEASNASVSNMFSKIDFLNENHSQIYISYIFTRNPEASNASSSKGFLKFYVWIEEGQKLLTNLPLIRPYMQNWTRSTIR